MVFPESRIMQPRDATNGKIQWTCYRTSALMSCYAIIFFISDGNLLIISSFLQVLILCPKFNWVFNNSNTPFFLEIWTLPNYPIYFPSFCNEKSFTIRLQICPYLSVLPLLNENMHTNLDLSSDGVSNHIFFMACCSIFTPSSLFGDRNVMAKIFPFRRHEVK